MTEFMLQQLELYKQYQEMCNEFIIDQLEKLRK